MMCGFTLILLPIVMMSVAIVMQKCPKIIAIRLSFVPVGRQRNGLYDEQSAKGLRNVSTFLWQALAACCGRNTGPPEFERGLGSMARLSLSIVAALLTLFSTLASASDQQDLPKQLTLSEAINIALANNSILRTAQSRLDQASGRYAQSRSVLLPQLDLNARQSYQTINLIGLGIDIPTVPQGKTGPFGSMDARLMLTQDLLNIANRESWKSSGMKQDSSRLLVSNAREIVVLDVVAIYLQSLRAKASRDALAEQTKLAKDLYNLTEDRVKQGVSAPLESNRALQQVNSLQQLQQEAEQSYAAAKLSLANALQARITSDFEVDDTAAYGTERMADRDTEIQSALASRPDYLAVAAQIKAAESQVKSVKAYRMPTVTASFSDGQSGETPVHNMNTYRLQGEINVPLFTSGRIRGQIKEAQGALSEAQATQDQLRSQIESEVLTAMTGVEWALKEVETSAANVTLSREEVELARQRFTRGITDNTEVVNAQDRISRADDAHVRAMYTLGLARANLARAAGAAEKTYHK
jgi:outer membrane protein